MGKEVKTRITDGNVRLVQFDQIKTFSDNLEEENVLRLRMETVRRMRTAYQIDRHLRNAKFREWFLQAQMKDVPVLKRNSDPFERD
jgi:hypothetical protein